MKKLEGKVAIITGASKGIGEGIARTYAKYGAKLVLAARGNGVLDLAELLTREGYEAVGVQADVSDRKSAEALVEAAVRAFGSLDVVVNNAGVCVLKSFLETDDADRDYQFDINIKGVWNVTRAALPHLIGQGGGAVVIMSSVTGDMVADLGEVAYATSKAALVGFTKSLAIECAQYQIRVNAICPGCIHTPLIDTMAALTDPEDPEGVIRSIESGIPLKRLGTPSEVGELAAFLGSNESSYLTGAQFVIDGGSTLPETSSFGT